MQFFIKIVAVEFDGPAADAQLVLDLFNRVAIGQKLQDFQFSIREVMVLCLFFHGPFGCAIFAENVEHHARNVPIETGLALSDFAATVDNILYIGRF